MKKETLNILKTLRLLIVEDDVNILQTYKKFFSLYFDLVLDAANGDEAIKLYQQDKPDVIITDVVMPVMDGLSFTNFIREFNDNIPIIAISAFTEKETLVGLIPNNLVAYLEKPVQFEELKKVLEKCVQKIIDNGLIEYRLSQNTIYSHSKKSFVVKKEVVPLTPNEVKFIELLIDNKNKLVTKEMIENIVYNGEYMSTPAINNLVSKIRKKIGTDGKSIITISSLGFMIV
ncbi:MAG: response regulator transcription factor [Campylobacterales bacterium]|nr:response regulator transcription factor [Campylobacterales bacterium]